MKTEYTVIHAIPPYNSLQFLWTDRRVNDWDDLGPLGGVGDEEDGLGEDGGETDDADIGAFLLMASSCRNSALPWIMLLAESHSDLRK